MAARARSRRGRCLPCQHRANRRVAACDTVLATAVAAHAALQALAFLDGDPAPPAVDGTLEISQADGRVRRRSWGVHPACGCSWDGRLDAEPA